MGAQFSKKRKEKKKHKHRVASPNAFGDTSETTERSRASGLYIFKTLDPFILFCLRFLFNVYIVK